MRNIGPPVGRRWCGDQDYAVGSTGLPNVSETSPTSCQGTAIEPTVGGPRRSAGRVMEGRTLRGPFAERWRQADRAPAEPSVTRVYRADGEIFSFIPNLGTNSLRPRRESSVPPCFRPRRQKEQDRDEADYDGNCSNRLADEWSARSAVSVDRRVGRKNERRNDRPQSNQRSSESRTAHFVRQRARGDGPVRRTVGSLRRRHASTLVLAEVTAAQGGLRSGAGRRSPMCRAARFERTRGTQPTEPQGHETGPTKPLTSLRAS